MFCVLLITYQPKLLIVILNIYIIIIKFTE